MPSLAMAWRDVLVASFPVAPGVVAERLPDRLAVDTFDEDAYLSVVPFRMENVRPKGLPAALGLTTPELNLRTYVTCGGTPGVYFFSLDVDDIVGVLGARLLTALPYYHADMTYEADGDVRFESRRRTPGAAPLRFAASYGPDGDPYRPSEGSVERFLVERYRFFTEGPGGAILSGAVDHEPWTLRPATWSVATNGVFRANGFEAPAGDPVLVFSPGVAVTATPIERW